DVIGWCDVIPKDHFGFHRHEGRLGMGIIATHRQKGVGSRLLSATLDAAFAFGLTRIELTVREANINAIALYKRCGFVVEGLQRHAVCIEGQYEDTLSMALLRNKEA
ncbi:MAG: GNAT family N-acetyltransferase, partial [Beijerinckiaceae bacterium]